MKKITPIFALLVSLAVPSFAQNSTLTGTPPNEPQLTEVEKLEIQILNLQYMLKAESDKTAQLTIAYGTCQATLLKDNSGLTSAAQALQEKINKNHPDSNFDITTGKFTPKEKPVEKK